MTNLAVVPTPMKRKAAVSPRSAGWTLYDPIRLAELLGLPVASVDAALEQTGFNKAVRIREEVIRWKENLRREERDLQDKLNRLNSEREPVRRRLATVREQLASTRNLLRIPREMPAA